MKEDISAKLIEYLEGTLTETDREAMEAALAKSSELQQELASLKSILQEFDQQKEELPSNNLRHRFYDYIEKEEANLQQSPGKLVSLFRLQKVEWGIAGAVAILLIGMAFGQLWQRNQKQQAQIDVLASEVATTRKLLVLSMLQEPSASQRIKALNASLETPATDPQIAEALVNTLLHDNNSNVRMKAATALTNFAKQKDVKEALIEALAKEDRPEVQITLIDVLVEVHAQTAVGVLEELLQKEDLMEVVRTKAADGLKRLI